MSVAIECFSIREYAERMRRIDMGKCWPFGREVKVCSLPPISLRKFRWWADELESERGDGEAAKVSLEEEDVCPTPARLGGRAKQKVPKKRSIVEIFAVAPQIEAVEEDDDGKDEEREDLGNGEREEVLERAEGNVVFDFVKEVQERNHQGHAVIRRKQIRLKRIKKQKQKKIIASKKVKSRRSKSPSAGLVSPISRKTKLKDPISEHTKKKRAQISKTRKNLKSIRASTCSGKKPDDCGKAPPLRSILKNRITSNKNTTVLARRIRGHHINSCGELIKHVSFSDKDDIKNAAPKELPQLQTVCKVLFSDALAASAANKNSSKGEKHSVAVEGPQLEMENVDVSTSSIRLADRPGGEKSHSSDLYGLTASVVDPNSINCPDKSKNKFENSDLNKNMQVHSSLSCPMATDSISIHCRPDSSNKKIADSSYIEDLSSNIRNHVQRSTSNTPAISRNSFHCRICAPRSDSTYSQTVTRNSAMQPLRSSIVSTMLSNNDSSQPSTVPNITESRPACLSSKHFLSSNCSSVGSMKFMELMQASDPMFFSRDKITNEDIISLPLNSQGELVKFNNPFTKQAFHCSVIPTHMEPMRKVTQENMKERLIPRESLYARNMSLVLPKQYCSSENHLTSGHNISELQNHEGMEAEKLEPVQIKDPYKGSFNSCKIQNCHCRIDRSTIDVAPQPTMRLMGTTVTIGEISKERKSFDNVKAWAGKKITTDQLPEQDKFKPSALWASQEKLLLSSRDHQSLHHILPLVRPNFDLHQSQMAFGLPSTNVNHIHPSQPYLHLTQQPLVHCNPQIVPFIRYPTPYPGTNFLFHPSPSSQSLIALPVYNIQTGSATSASFVPGYSVSASISANNSNQVSRDQSAWNHGHKMKRRLAEKGQEFIRPLKKAHVIFPVKSCSFSRPVGRGQNNMFHPRNIGASTGVLRHGYEARNLNTQFSGFKNDEYRRFIESNSKYHRGMKSSQNMKTSSSNTIYKSQVGLAKLRAGAKHVLKPCRNSDYKSSKLVHSAIPLVTGDASSRNVVSHKKLEEIYSF
ncbi:uncharacterized protein LOC110095328 isoform X1 [Dendrobium catenatum]|uniref:Protein EMBRYONIC FLOWER 1 n=1 Tax=Dendrobium catenatum TaxID=906689 RepID=A0A2I0WYF0_9ASPA|nr:uncharacterized protein LOC110095328 isoform X1 [Dendrobium catenatum]PKU80676.1 hypothetical protein MA16_Dca012434 [Dendrobium catenatum]